VEAIRAQGQPHNVQHQEADVIKWFGLNQTGGTTPPPTTKPPTTSSTPPPRGGGTVAKWGLIIDLLRYDNFVVSFTESYPQRIT